MVPGMFIITVYLLFSMLLVLWLDTTRYIIPNWLSGSLLALYPIALLLARHPVDWQLALAGMFFVLAIGYFIFSRRWMGGGDIKLITVASLWVGWQNLVEYLFDVTLLGGALSVALLFGRKWGAPYLQRDGKPLPRILRNGEPVPYGIAIAVGFLIMVWLGKIPAIR
ncbi:MAG: prepilin peptidase [Pseudomonadota bacterium]|nr:prepilin peptidase [Pseudomonadota bacterium]